MIESLYKEGETCSVPVPQGKPTVAVIYLDWYGADSEAVRRFAGSYIRHSAGIDHNLYFLPKEYPDGCQPAISGGIRLPNLPGTVMDIPAYFHAAEQVKEDVVCFLNTGSEILVDDWLRKLREPLDRIGVDAAGATGSYERLPFPDWPPFPNVHLRTNAFIMRRNMFLMLPRRPKLEADKKACWGWESGPDGLTQHLLRMNSRAVVAGADGRVFEFDQWPKSGTFRQTEQENLLVGDNHTRAYAAADFHEREYLRQMAWGERAWPEWRLAEIRQQNNPFGVVRQPDLAGAFAV